ncbi:hypothetical protein KCMC57_up12120 [Kitasatospora sp. CMC57]|uniref:Uncharacterized protein n=1 Tax=Kitasatospora sp. CMC57 TaxID=3231513 RepID=A0AB33JWB9_9ACTN
MTSRDKYGSRRRAGCGEPGRVRQTVALAVAADEAAYARLRGCGLFGAADYGAYLRRTEQRLRALHGHGMAVHLRVLEPVDFEDFCAEHLLDPADPVAEVAYAADPELAGEPFAYTGQRLAELLPALTEDHLARVRISIGCAALLAAVGCERQPQERVTAVLQYVSEVCLALAAGAGDGRHRLTLRSLGLLDGEELTAAAELLVAAGRPAELGREAEAFCVTLAAAVAGYGSGELLLYLACGEVAGWVLVDGWLRPMSALETQAVLGAEGAGPPGPVGRAGFPLPPEVTGG